MTPIPSSPIAQKPAKIGTRYIAVERVPAPHGAYIATTAASVPFFAVPSGYDKYTLLDPADAAELDRLKRVCPNVEGFQTGSKKQMLLEGLCMSIQQRTIAFPENSRECPIQGELEAYEYDYTSTGRVSYGAPEGLHDDCVVGLALAALRHDKVKVAGQIKVEWVGLDTEERDIWESMSENEWEGRLA